MNIIKKAFLRAFANVFLAIGAGIMVTGGINLVSTADNIPMNVITIAVGIAFMLAYVIIDVGLVIGDMVQNSDGEE
ncbi:hypothetical protein RUK22_003298 [Vibrio cholerae]|uniref:hypothetical protein n=1 Tax=Vibrio TaxID=662 RepID=UPI00056E91DA|nr:MULTISPECIES: hypothetical protein [Vibrio]EGQ8650575.1 hypothetical protein [Vibrio cholerae]EGQ8651193.1 hypothetical protein [Vibrio cholerae]EGR4184966.1 hypothetical protein [Vibrio cholerae]EGR4421482.1 hypothetical protein [Vibrio cholerae]EII5635348.1 hypothetical protein [Vibrio cholerae]